MQPRPSVGNDSAAAPRPAATTGRPRAKARSARGESFRTTPTERRETAPRPSGPPPRRDSADPPPCRRCPPRRAAAACTSPRSGPSPATRRGMSARAFDASSSVRTPFGRQAPDKKSVVPAGCSGALRRSDEVGLDKKPGCGNPAFDELAAGELREDDVGVDLPLPGPQGPMQREHRRHDGRARTRAPVAAVQKGRPRRPRPQALLADAAPAIQRRSGAQQAVVVERLHHRHAGSAASVVDAGRQQRKGIVEVSDVGPELGKGGLQPTVSPMGPEGAASQGDRLDRADRSVVGRQGPHVVAAAAQQRGLRVKDRVLAAGLPIPVVHEEDLHRLTTAGRRRRARPCSPPAARSDRPQRRPRPSAGTRCCLPRRRRSPATAWPGGESRSPAPASCSCGCEGCHAQRCPRSRPRPGARAAAAR